MGFLGGLKKAKRFFKKTFNGAKKIGSKIDDFYRKNRPLIDKAVDGVKKFNDKAQEVVTQIEQSGAVPQNITQQARRALDISNQVAQRSQRVLNKIDQGFDYANGTIPIRRRQ